MASIIRKGLVAATYGLIIFCFAGCSSDKEPTGPDVSGVDSYLSGLPSWSEFSPLVPETDPISVSDPVTHSDTLDVTRITEDGGTEVIPDVRYSCTETKYSISKTPTKFVMFGGPGTDMLWPGALVQGGSLRDLGDLLPLTIQERTLIEVSIPALATADNYRTVAPSQAGVASAIGEMIGDADISQLETPSSIAYTMRECRSEDEFALHAGMSARYLGFSAAAHGSYSERSDMTTITVQFYQRMFEVVVEPPQTPGAFFSDAFTPEKLQEQVALGRMGPENLPIYVSKVVYGRMLMFKMSSTASREEIQATVSMAYSGIGGGGSANLSVQQKAILANAEYEIASLGGSAQDVLNIIRSGDWSLYFTAEPSLSTAAPLSYEFRNLGDGSIALVSETTEYTQKVCHAVSSSTVFGGRDPIDENEDGIADRFCPQRIAGGCDFNGYPSVTLSVDYEIDETAIRAVVGMHAAVGGAVAQSTWILDLLKAPAGTRVGMIGGLAPEEWRTENAADSLFTAGWGLSGDYQLGIATFRIIGDTHYDDICGACDQDEMGRSGIWSIAFRETPVDLTMNCCP